LRIEKNYQHVLDGGPLEFRFLRQRGCPTNPFRTPSLCFGVIGKTPGLISLNNFVKKFLSASAIAIMSLQDVTLSSLSSGVEKTMNTNFSFLFQNPKNYSLGDVQRFCYHSWCISTVIFDQISNSSNVSSVRVDFGRPALSSSSTSSLRSRNLEYHVNTFHRFRASFP
jgi:hypothetical protein